MFGNMMNPKVPANAIDSLVIPKLKRNAVFSKSIDETLQNYIVQFKPSQTRSGKHYAPV